jgi:hypothetical protein
MLPVVNSSLSGSANALPHPDIDARRGHPVLSITPNFTWHEALYLPQWGREASPAEGLDEKVKAELANVFSKLELIRDFLGSKPVIIHCAFRPVEYNKLVGGAPASAHLEGKAVDFHVKGLHCDTVRNFLVLHLDTLGIRLEDNPGSNWVHIDTRESKTRYFKP